VTGAQNRQLTAMMFRLSRRRRFGYRDDHVGVAAIEANFSHIGGSIFDTGSAKFFCN
jgi:hypothetical protein